MYLPLHMVIFQLTMLGFRACRLDSVSFIHNRAPSWIQRPQFWDNNCTDFATNTPLQHFAPQKINQGTQKHLFDWHLFVEVLYLYTPPEN